MADEQHPTPSDSDHVRIKKKYLLWSSAAVAMAVLLLVWLMPSSSSEKTAVKHPVFHRDEPVPPQILKDDFKEKIGEMLDSGMSVFEISRQTGVRKDVIRKIKKEKTSSSAP